MIKKYVSLCAAFLLLTCPAVYAHESGDSSQHSVYLIDFKFEKRDLKDILNEFAQLRGVNILYSSTTQLNSKVTFDAGKKITFMKAWELLLMMIEQAGFSLVNQGKDLYTLIPAEGVGNSPLPVYMNVHIDELPQTAERIRYVYHFKNISLTNQQADITNVVKNFFDQKTINQQLLFDPNFNAMIITAKGETIKAVMQFINIFDQAGEKQIAEVINLKYANAKEVEAIFTDIINGQDGSNKTKTAQKPTAAVDSNTLFSPATKVKSLFGNLAYGQGSAAVYPNSLAIIGKKSDVDHVKQFIMKTLDVPLEQGLSFYHVVDLQWISADAAATILNALKSPPSGSGQSTSTNLSNLAFDPSIQIVPEAITKGVSPSGDMTQPLANGVQNIVQRGSNKLIIAAAHKDWARLHEVIKKIDIPQKQVIIEALVLDLSLLFTHKLATQIRTTGLVNSIFPKNMQAQAAMLLPAILSNDGSAAASSTSLNGDLSKILGIIDIPGAETQSNSSTIVMVGDAKNTNGIWAFFQILALHASTKTVSRVFVTARNNQPAVVSNSITKRLPGKLTAGVTATVSYQTVSAPVDISFTPLISGDDIINLQIMVNATYWNDPTGPISGTSTNRLLQTNFSLKDGQVAVLGGLTRDQSQVTFRGVPFLSKIPILGPLLFSNKLHRQDKNKLVMVVKVSKVKPLNDGGMGKITRRMAKVANHLLDGAADDEELFSSIKDPISRWIFNEDDPVSQFGKDLSVDTLLKRHQSLRF